MMQRTLAQLKRQCDGLKLAPVPTKKTKEGAPKFLRDDYIQALRAYYLAENYPNGVPKHLQIILQIESPMLCFRYNELKPAEQTSIWESDEWGIEEKFDGCRMVMIFVRGEGLAFYSRNISVKDFCPIGYTNIWHETDYGQLGEYFDNFVIDTEIMCDNPNVCRIMEERGIPTETVLSAVTSLLALNEEESLAIQQKDAPLNFKVFDTLMVNDDWSVMGMPLQQRRKGLRQMVEVLKSCNLTRIRLSDLTTGTAAKQAEYERVLGQGGEGVVAKRLASPYEPTSSRKRDAWVKIKRSMKNSLTNTGFGDTLDGWISGFSLGEEGKGWENYVGAIHVSIFIRNSAGEVREHEIARISGLSEDLRKDMTETGPDGKPCMKQEYYDRVVEIDGQCVSSRAHRLKHARLVRFREDKYKDLCVIEEDFLNAMIL